MDLPNLKLVKLQKVLERNSSMAKLSNMYPISARQMFPKSFVDEFYVEVDPY